MKLKITVHGVAYEVEVEVLDPGEGFAAGPLPSVRPSNAKVSGGSTHDPAPSAPGPASPAAAAGGSVTSPIAGTVVEVKCKPGDPVSEGQILLVVEAMKMNTSIAAPTAGRVKSVPVAAGDNVREGQILLELE
jgi:biotin carboxyl carrier protein